MAVQIEELPLKLDLENISKAQIMRDLISQFNEILPLACKWAESQEKLILQKGRPLSPQLLSDAKKIGVAYPDKVRVLAVNAIPRPKHPLLKAACNQTNFLTPDTDGLTLRYGIYIRSDCANERRLYVHELVHVAQYEELGGIQQFLQKYLSDIATIGYSSAPMEQEALKIAKDIRG